MGYVSREINKFPGNLADINRNCVISKVVENMIKDGDPVDRVYSRNPFKPVITGGTSTIKVYAAGKQGNNYPTVALVINNRLVKEWKDVKGNPESRQFIELSYTHPTKVTADQVIVSQNSGNLHDETNVPQQLYVDKINIDGTDYQTEAPTTFNAATWSPQFASCIAVSGEEFPQREQLQCKGYIAFSADASAVQRPLTTQAPIAEITFAPTDTPVPTLPSPVTPVTAARSMLVAAGFIGLITMGFIVFGL